MRCFRMSATISTEHCLLIQKDGDRLECQGCPQGRQALTGLTSDHDWANVAITEGLKNQWEEMRRWA